MKLFGEYLLEKNLVKEEELLKAYMDRLAASPSWPEVFFRHKLLPGKSILAALGHMARHQVDFKSACHELGLWSPAIEEALRNESMLEKFPICRALLEGNAISLPVLTRALDEYLADAQNITPVSQASRKEPPSAGYALFFDSICEASLSNVADALSAADGEARGIRLREGCETLSALRGAARMVRAAESEKLCERLEGILASAIASLGGPSLPDFKHLGELCKQTIEQLSGLKSALVADGSEASYREKSLPSLQALHSKLGATDPAAQSGAPNGI